jgi:hypothetical protein
MEGAHPLENNMKFIVMCLVCASIQSNPNTALSGRLGQEFGPDIFKHTGPPSAV